MGKPHNLTLPLFCNSSLLKSSALTVSPAYSLFAGVAASAQNNQENTQIYCVVIGVSIDNPKACVFCVGSLYIWSAPSNRMQSTIGSYHSVILWLSQVYIISPLHTVIATSSIITSEVDKVI
jgi:hypothetical protein